VLIKRLFFRSFFVSEPDLSGFSAPAGAPPPANGDAPQPDARIAELEKTLADSTAESERLREDFLRAKAETENVRRRAAEDVSKAHRFGVESFAGALLAVKDSLDAALTVENTSIESFKEGVELTARQLASVFEKYAITEIDPQGQKFDPHRHQAISQVEVEGEPNTVVTVLQKGYLLHDRVLRPALVVVSKLKNA
jgi:molecular chaperone GrpE